VNGAAARPNKTTGCELVDSIEGLRERRLERAARTHRELYEDLTAAFQHALEIKQRPASQNVLRLLLRKPKLKFDTLDKCIKHVIDREFGESERQRSFVYRRALQVAAAKNIASGGLAEWLEKKGGVEKISADNPVRARSKSSEDKVETSDAFAQQKDFLFEVDIPQGINLKDNSRQVAVILVADGKLRFREMTADYEMWAAVQRRFAALRQPRGGLRTSRSRRPETCC
jgi:hypothetical protein